LRIRHHRYGIVKYFVRDDLCLPRTCRQIYSETRPFLETYIFIRFSNGRQSMLWYSKWLPEALSKAGRSFDKIKEAFLEDAQVRLLQNLHIGDLKNYYAGLVVVFPHLV